MSLDWPTLRALIDTADTGAVAAAVAGLDDTARRRLGKPLQAYAKQWHTDLDAVWSGPANPDALLARAAAVRVAGAGCLSGVDAIARWLADFRLWRDNAGGGDVIDVLRSRPEPCLTDVALRMAGRLRRNDWSPESRFVVDLVAAAGVAPPETEVFVSAWADRLEHGTDADDRLAGRLRTDPLLPVVAPMLFTVDGQGHRLEPDAYRPGVNWVAALAALAAEDVVSRGMLVDGCISRLLRGGRPGELRGYVHLYEALVVTVDEAADQVRGLARLLADAPSTVAGLAQRELRRVDDAGRLVFDLAAGALPADLRAQLASAWALPASAPARPPRPALGAPEPRDLPPPIGSPGELAEELLAARTNDMRGREIDATAVERILAAVVAFAHTDRDGLKAAIAPILPRLAPDPLLPAAVTHSRTPGSTRSSERSPDRRLTWPSRCCAHQRTSAPGGGRPTGPSGRCRSCCTGSTKSPPASPMRPFPH
jgi:hypothetical protein